MKESYSDLTQQMEVLAQALAMVAEEFAQTHQIETAVAGYVLAGMVMKQVCAADQKLDEILESTPV